MGIQNEHCYCSFGMRHDTAANQCVADEEEIQYVMSPQLSVRASPLVWSNCSRKTTTKFLE